MNPLTPEARKVIELVRARSGPDSTALARVETRLAERVAAGAGLAAAGTLVTKVASGATSLVSVAKIGVVVAAIGAVSVGGWYAARYPRHSSAAVPVLASSLDSLGPRESAELAVPSVAPDASVQTDGVASARVQQATPRSSKTMASASANNAETLDPLMAETRDLGLAQQALRGGDPERALKLLDQQDLTYKRGALQQERAAARVLALCQSRPKGTATAEVERFERRWPKSPLVARLRTSCGLR